MGKYEEYSEKIEEACTKLNEQCSVFEAYDFRKTSSTLNEICSNFDVCLLTSGSAKLVSQLNVLCSEIEDVISRLENSLNATVNVSGRIEEGGSK